MGVAGIDKLSKTCYTLPYFKEESMKITEPKFSLVPQFTRTSSYRIDLAWKQLEFWLDHQEKDYGVELEPDFQRAHVWDKKRQIAYVEFCLRGGKSSKEIYFNCPAYGHNHIKGKSLMPDTVVLVDGLQRLTAVRKFMNNEIKAFGYFFKDFTDHMDMMDARFSVNVNDLDTRAEVLQWYIDLNAGGVAHTDEDIEKVRVLLKKEKK